MRIYQSHITTLKKLAIIGFLSTISLCVGSDFVIPMHATENNNFSIAEHPLYTSIINYGIEVNKCEMTLFHIADFLARRALVSTITRRHAHLKTTPLPENCAIITNRELIDYDHPNFNENLFNGDCYTSNYAVMSDSKQIMQKMQRDVINKALQEMRQYLGRLNHLQVYLQNAFVNLPPIVQTDTHAQNRRIILSDLFLIIRAQQQALQELRHRLPFALDPERYN